MRIRSFVFALALGATSTACASPTTIEHVWRSPEWPGSFTHIVIFGMSKRAGVRRDFEERMAHAFAEVGVRATPSYRLFPHERELRDEDIARVLAERGANGSLVARLVAVNQQYYYFPGSPYLMLGGPRYGFYGHYHGAYAMMYSPGYLVEYNIVTIETNLYDVATSELVWSGLSDTFDPKNIEDAIESYSRTMVETLLDSGLVTPTMIERRD